MDDGIEPRRSHDELMQVVVHKGEAIKARRRRFLSLGGGAAVLMAALVAGLLTATSRLDDTRVLAASAPRSTTTLAVPSAPVDTGGLGGALPYELPPMDARTTVTAPPGAPAAAATTVAPRSPEAATAVQAGGGQTASALAPATTTTVAQARLPECSRSHLAATVAVDRPAYLPGQKVVMTSTLRNTAAQPCYIVGYSFRSVFNDGSGRAVTLTSALAADYFREEPFAPGQTVTQTREWDQQICTHPDNEPERCAPAPPGSYQGAVRWDLPGGPYEAAARFAVASVPITIPQPAR